MTHLKVHRSLLTGKRVVTRRLAVGVRQILVENGNVARQLAISRLEPPRRVNWTHASSLDSRVRSRLAMKLLVGTRTAAVHPRCPNPTFVASVTLILVHVKSNEPSREKRRFSYEIDFPRKTYYSGFYGK